MKTSRTTILLNSLILQVFLLVNSTISQEATAEFITSMPTPTLKENIQIKDGERFVLYRDNYLFTVNFWIGIQVWDISVIEKPKRIAFLETGDMVYHIALHENRLFAANKTDGVIIFDITNMNRPYEVARIKTPGDAYWLDIQYPYLYVALGKEGFCVMDISNLEDPRTLTLEIPETWVWSLKYRDGKLYVAAKQGGLLIYDASNPSNLTRITQYKTGFHALQFHLEDNLAYLADGPGGLLILDISAPRLPKEIGRFKTEGFSHHVFKSGNYAYLSNREMGLLIIKVNDPRNPRLEARYVSEAETYASFKEDVYVFLSTDTKTEILRHNNQPVLEPLADLSIDENSDFVLQLEGNDPDGDAIYYEAHNLPEGSQFNRITGLFTWKPTYEQSGNYPDVIFSVIERTGSQLSDSDTITVTVNHVNRLPELPSIANVSFPEDSLHVIRVPEGSDPDREDVGNLTYRVENAPDGVIFDPLSRTFRWKPTFDQSGNYIVDFILDDGAGGIDREAVTLTVKHVDRPPVIAGISHRTINEAETLVLTLDGKEFDKEDLNKIAYSMFNLPNGGVFDAASQRFSWTPTYDQSGIYENIGAVMKAGVLSDTTYFTITVQHVNRPPVLAAIPEQTIDENKNLIFTISGSDPDREDSGKLTYSATNVPAGSSFNPDSLKFTWTPTFEQSGSYSGISFAVKDPQGLSDQKTTAIVVNHVNRQPVLADIPPQTIDENQLLTVQLSASDPDREDAGQLTFSAIEMPEGANLDPTTGAFSWTPGYDQSGNYEITVTVSDGNLTDSKIMVVTVNHVNRTPVLSDIPDQIVDENVLLSFVASGSDPDKEDQGKLIYTSENLPAGSNFDPQSRTFTWKPNYEQSGVYGNIIFRVTDPAGLMDEQSITITVVHVNRPPSLVEIPPKVNKEQEMITFTLEGSDTDREDEGKLTYQISNLPDGALLNSSNGEFSWTPSYEQSGEYVLRAMVTDSAGSTASVDIPIKIENVNRPPVADVMEPVSGMEIQPLTVTLKMSDPDREDEGKLTVTAENLPAGAELDAQTGELSWTPTYEQSGSYTVNYKITDSFGAQAAGMFTLNIENVNRAPSLPDISDLTTPENQMLSTVLPEGSDPDSEDRGNLSYTLQNMPDGASFDPASRVLEWTPS
ncbi:MAG: tandem-95 repeat protein, partial [Calditrichaeota bacterium]